MTARESHHSENWGGPREGASPPKKDPRLRRVQAGIRLPQWLLDKLDELPDNRATTIEKLLCKTYKWKAPKIIEIK